MVSKGKIKRIIKDEVTADVKEVVYKDFRMFKQAFYKALNRIRYGKDHRMYPKGAKGRKVPPKFLIRILHFSNLPTPGFLPLNYKPCKSEIHKRGVNTKRFTHHRPYERRGYGKWLTKKSMYRFFMWETFYRAKQEYPVSFIFGWRDAEARVHSKRWWEATQARAALPTT
jgi:hypothetical protein